MLFSDDLLQGQACALKNDNDNELFNQCHTEENCDASIQEVEIFVVGEGAHDRVDQSYSEEGKSKNDSQEESPFSVFCVGYREGSNCSCYAKENEGNNHQSSSSFVFGARCVFPCVHVRVCSIYAPYNSKDKANHDNDLNDSQHGGFDDCIVAFIDGVEKSRKKSKGSKSEW